MLHSIRSRWHRRQQSQLTMHRWMRPLPIAHCPAKRRRRRRRWLRKEWKDGGRKRRREKIQKYKEREAKGQKELVKERGMDAGRNSWKQWGTEERRKGRIYEGMRGRME